MNRWNIPGWIARLIVKQPVFVLLATAVTAIFWAITGLAPSIGTTVIYSLVLGNITTWIIEAAQPAYSQHRSVTFWLLSLALLVVFTPLAVIVASAIVFASLTPLPRGSFVQFLLTGWKFPTVANCIFGVVYLRYSVSRVSLEYRNRELERLARSDAAEREVDAEELRRAQQIQKELLPRKLPCVAGLEIAGAWEPARQVGGDYYDVIELSKDKIGICIADVVGKGISAALLMANTQATVRALAAPSASAACICSRINSVLCANIAPGTFVTLFYGVVDVTSKTLQYANAGHLRPILIDNRGGVRHLEGGGALLGVFPNWDYQDCSVELHPGDLLLLFTDGITEARSSEGAEFGEERLIASVIGSPKQSVSELQTKILEQVKAFCSNRMSDDAALLILAVPSVTCEHRAQQLVGTKINESPAQYAGVH